MSVTVDGFPNSFAQDSVCLGTAYCFHIALFNSMGQPEDLGIFWGSYLLFHRSMGREMYLDSEVFNRNLLKYCPSDFL